MTVGLLYSILRLDEKLILQAAEKNHVNILRIDVSKHNFNPSLWKQKVDVVVERCISRTQGLQGVLFFESLGIPVISSSEIAFKCENKFYTSLLLQKNNIPTIPFALVFNESEAKKAVKSLGGYPIVLKPISGSWGRMIDKVNDDDALEALVEHKNFLGSSQHKVLYMQQFIKKPGRDIRVTVVGKEVVCAIYRETDHWITNTARQAVARNCPLDKDLIAICKKVTKVIGEGVLGIDVFETKKGYVINEVNNTAEFKNVQRVTGVDVGEKIIKYAIKQKKL